MRVAQFLRQPPVLDAGLALLLVATSMLLGRGLFFYDADTGLKAGALFGSVAALREHLWWWWLAAIPAVAALLIRWRWPLVAFALAAASALVHLLDLRLRLVGLPLLPIDLAAAVTLYTVASVAVRRRTGLVALGTAVAVHYVLVALAIRGEAIGGYVRAGLLGVSNGRVSGWAAALWLTAVPALLLGIAWAVGDNTRNHRRQRAASDLRAAQAQRERDQRAGLAVAAERARITRELHDVVAHGLSVMVVQAQAAEAALRAEPDTAEVALTHVIDTGRASLAEMRRLLTVVRREPDGLELAPQPGMGALPALIDQVRNAGTPVHLHIDGEPVPLPAAVDLSAYRIVQEALTNTRRHAGTGASATVRLAYAASRVEIEIADDGPGNPNGSGVGNGLRGIAERVRALGGEVFAGPHPGGGFGVRAVLPTAAAP